MIIHISFIVRIVVYCRSKTMSLVVLPRTNVTALGKMLNSVAVALPGTPHASVNWSILGAHATMAVSQAV